MADIRHRRPPPEKVAAASTAIEAAAAVPNASNNTTENSTTEPLPAMELSSAERKLLLQLASEIAYGGELASYVSYVGVGEQVCEALRYSRRIDPELVVELFHYHERAIELREALRASNTAPPSATMLREELREVDNA